MGHKHTDACCLQWQKTELQVRCEQPVGLHVLPQIPLCTRVQAGF